MEVRVSLKIGVFLRRPLSQNRRQSMNPSPVTQLQLVAPVVLHLFCCWVGGFAGQCVPEFFRKEPSRLKGCPFSKTMLDETMAPRPQQIPQERRGYVGSRQKLWLRLPLHPPT